MKSSVISLSQINFNAIVYKLIYYIITGVLISSGLAKIIDSAGMLNTLEVALSFISDDIIVITATIIPIVEISLGMMLLLKMHTSTALSLSVILFAGFFLFSIYGKVIGLDEDCGCFGNLIKLEFGWGMIIRNFILLFFASLLKVFPSSIKLYNS